MILNAAVGLAAVWALSIVALIYIIGRELLHHRRQPGQGAPRWVPEPPAVDLGIVEDDQVAELDALYDMPAGIPGAW